MTFEEVKHRIAAGTAPATLEEIASGIAVLVKGTSDVEQSIAIRLYESQLIHGKKDWCKWALKTFRYYDDKATVYRRCAVGEMLCLLRDSETCLFRKHITTPISMLERLLPILHDRKFGFNGLVNFLKLYWKDTWTRDRLCAERDRFMRPESDDPGITKRGPQTFQFDGLQVQEEAEIAAFIEAQRVQPERAGVMVRNGVMLCSAALPYMMAHPEVFDEADVPELEGMRQRLETAASRIAELIAAQSRKALAL